jgi:RNA polymerase sigma-70 factor (ECF subfamily)
MTSLPVTPQPIGTANGPTSDRDVDRTSSTLLDHVRDWRDRPAWNAFFAKYDPLLRLWCQRDGLRGDAADELCQRIWIELMARMRTFRYDPSRGFRRWLRRLFRSRAIDFARHQYRTQSTLSEDVLVSEPMARAGHHPSYDLEPDDDDVGAEAARLFALAQVVQTAVRARVDPASWQAFQMIAIEDRPVREVASELGKKYTAVYNAYKRVDKMLRQEGERLVDPRSMA